MNNHYHIVSAINPDWYPQDDSQILCISHVSTDELISAVQKQLVTLSSMFSDLQKEYVAGALYLTEYHVSTYCPNPLSFKPYQQAENTQIVLALAAYEFVKFYYITEG